MHTPPFIIRLIVALFLLAGCIAATGCSLCKLLLTSEWKKVPALKRGPAQSSASHCCTLCQSTSCKSALSQHFVLLGFGDSLSCAPSQACSGWRRWVCIHSILARGFGESGATLHGNGSGPVTLPESGVRSLWVRVEKACIVSPDFACHASAMQRAHKALQQCTWYVPAVCCLLFCHVIMNVASTVTSRVPQAPVEPQVCSSAL